MNDLLQKLMINATELTRNGQLQEATQAIQRALRGGASEVFGVSDPATPPPATRASIPSGEALVLDGLTRVIDPPPEIVEEILPEQSGVAVKEAVDLDSVEVDSPREERWLDGSFTHQGRTLAYKLYLPPGATGAAIAPRPMVVMLHGCTQGAADFATGTQMNALARDLGVVVLYPEQTQHANAQKCWNWFKPQHQQRGRGEPAVLAALAQTITAEHHVDAARVYVAGLSAGGAMADIVGRCYPDVFAAVGVHSGLPCGSATDVMTALSAMRSGSALAPSGGAGSPVPPTIVFHGDADATVHVSNGAAIIEAARKATGQTIGRMPSARTAEGHSGKGQRYTRTVYADEAGRSTAEYWQLHNAGHAWSGGSSRGSYTNPTGADASAEMLRFFLAHPLRA
ncbi:extracellular catalytic domain type 1 short-chain-length polyhydroxyalkanoate depolymerase [Variovorax saccharolyticus]|uniref:extracellular catalytic domain type 1 short-chain-length polyhydroxyalkanoate depolymerase n=1 Tax=Variovorax saccharolyticus TaxID=3053516 RepID=UPI002575983D|nr:PHB depolymerase family esterase [Variovorax sp. J31P216]MDM0028336.1 PHB depolymerase family esterase [Variovorax sp. J31P216]